MPSVARINITPVKSTTLHHPPCVELGPRGAEGDRRFFLVDGDGRRFSGDRKGPLLAVRADHDPATDRLRFRLPEGAEAEGPAAATGDALVVNFYGRDVPAHLVPGPWEGMLSAFVGRPVRLARPDRTGDALDVEPVTLVSLASVDELSRQGGSEGRVDPDRFRMLLEVDGCGPHEEDRWWGRLLKIGRAVIRAGAPVPRCVVTTLDPATGMRDFPTLSVIKRYRGVTSGNELPFGIYGRVERVGAVAVGDRIDLLD
ncbi:MAG TPA: MOSC domain-containing protein [Actinomycetota bacterium]|jgi:uncharacterized protein YcbX|nr:MOSC domain-containing protein [Actinomycetota bacterium]